MPLRSITRTDRLPTISGLCATSRGDRFLACSYLTPQASERVPTHGYREYRRPHSSDIVERAVLDKRGEEMCWLDEHHAEQECTCREVADRPALEQHDCSGKPHDGGQ